MSLINKSMNFFINNLTERKRLNSSVFNRANAAFMLINIYSNENVLNVLNHNENVTSTFFYMQT